MVIEAARSWGPAHGLNHTNAIGTQIKCCKRPSGDLCSLVYMSTCEIIEPLRWDGGFSNGTSETTAMTPKVSRSQVGGPGQQFSERDS